MLNYQRVVWTIDIPSIPELTILCLHKFNDVIMYIIMYILSFHITSQFETILNILKLIKNTM